MMLQNPSFNNCWISLSVFTPPAKDNLWYDNFLLRFLMNFIWIQYRFPIDFYGMAMDFICISNEIPFNFMVFFHYFPMDFLWVSFEYLIDFLWISYSFLMDFLRTSNVFPMEFLLIAYRFPMNFLQNAYGVI